MKRLKLKTYGGESFQEVAAKAIEVAQNTELVEFEFNDVVCVVNKDTNPEWLLRDYMNSWLMGWAEIGPYCVASYSPEIQKQLKEKKEAQERRREKEQQEYNKKMKLKAEEINSKIASIEIELSDPASWKQFVEANTDPYGAAAIKYAEHWARLMQYEFAQGKKIADCAESTSHDADADGITGFMYGCAVSMLAKCWKHGEALRLWHNLKTQIHGEGEKANESGGVLNPALMSIGK